MTDSFLQVDDQGKVSSYVGPDAVELYRVKTLRSFILLWQRTKIIPTRGVTITKMLAQASAITKKPYKVKQTQVAADDLAKWIGAMLAAIPVEKRSK